MDSIEHIHPTRPPTLNPGQTGDRTQPAGRAPEQTGAPPMTPQDRHRLAALLGSTPREAPAPAAADADSSNDADAGAGLDPAVRRWIPLVVPMLALLLCAGIATIWSTL
jgi:hypothetical protein